MAPRGTSLDRHPVEEQEQPKDAAAILRQAQNFIVSNINPKFQNYNRPFLLALIVGAIMLVSTIITANYLYWNGCYIQQSSGPTLQMTYGFMGLTPNVICYNYLVVLDDDDLRVCCPKNLPGWTLPPCEYKFNALPPTVKASVPYSLDLLKDSWTFTPAAKDAGMLCNAGVKAETSVPDCEQSHLGIKPFDLTEMSFIYFST
jgi:hypothetical protein